MNPKILDDFAATEIRPDSTLVLKHLRVLEEMVRIDSRSFSVNEFEGDRKNPSDMKDILDCASNYLREIGFKKITINTPPKKCVNATPILLAELAVSPSKPTLLFYAHLDKQPYMDDDKFEKWGGIAPTKLTWNSDRTRAFGRGAADDLSGVISIGMAIDATLRAIESDKKNLFKDKFLALPCNIKILYETEEECGSHSLVEQILQNQEFFNDVNCVVITDVINPATGYPGLTTSLRGITQLEITVDASPIATLDPQTALYKLLATLIKEDHSLAIDLIADADILITEEERIGFSHVPTSINLLRNSAGLLPETILTVPTEITSILEAQLRKSSVNARPGHRIAGSIIFGRAGARIRFNPSSNPEALQLKLLEFFKKNNPFNLKITVRRFAEDSKFTSFDLILASSTKDPHSGVNGGPFPVAELQLARMIDRLIKSDGSLPPEIQKVCGATFDKSIIETCSLFVDEDETVQLFEDSSAKAIVEIRLAPGNKEKKAENALKEYLQENLPKDYKIKMKSDRGASPWITPITHPIFPVALEALEMGYGQKACIYGCGGSIPFVAKLTDAIPGTQPLCLGPYDPDSRMHEPGESLSLVDLLGCTRSILHLMARINRVFQR
ncbi:MAG: M20/M25/M40 family metallo-hydrolase [Nitrospina sp.]|nr:M20/M25/M40 family metallo-hydrolase [Nitrospina sp.]